MYISIDENHTIHIVSFYPGPSVALDLSARDTLTLLQGLKQHEAQITDLATNYYSCKECGYEHSTRVQVCPKLHP
jgi:hypothetical protein